MVVRVSLFLNFRLVAISDADEMKELLEQHKGMLLEKKKDGLT